MNALAEPSDPTWYAVLTKPRGEGIALINLLRQGFECMYPRVRHLRRHASGMRDSVDALFPRYLFLRADADITSLAPVRSTRGVAGLVKFGMRPARVPNRVIAEIRARVECDDIVRLSAPDLVAGMSVRVTEGPFSGVSAIFQKTCGADRVRLLMHVLGEACQVVVPREHLAASL